MQRKMIQVEERPPLLMSIPLSFQHLFAMFSASVLVPFLFGIDSAVVLLMNGVGTLLFILITKGKAPAFLGSSFAFLMPAGIVIGNMAFNPAKTLSGGMFSEQGYSEALGGFVVVGAVFCIVALIIKFFGIKWINIALPPAAMGPVVALIGLELAGVAANMGGLTATTLDLKVVAIFLVTLLTAVFGSVLFKKFFAVIPILTAIIVGYLFAWAIGGVDFSVLNAQASFFAIPHFRFPTFNWAAILAILPASLVVISEHIGHQLVTGKIVGRDLIKDPGLDRSLFSDGVSTMLSGFVGAVPTTTYGENIGVMAITKVYSVWVIGGAAVISICLAFIGKVSALISTIPGPVMGGVSFLLYGMIAASGIRLMVESKIDYSKSRNLALTSVVFVTGLSGAYIPINGVPLKGMALATVVGIVLSLIFYAFDKLKISNDVDFETVPEEK